LYSLNEEIEKAAEMLGQAIEINPQNIQARTRLGTLIHLFGSSTLSSMAG
jgi:hypothetical protein